jgi:hypothetical protein
LVPWEFYIWIGANLVALAQNSIRKQGDAATIPGGDARQSGAALRSRARAAWQGRSCQRRRWYIHFAYDPGFSVSENADSERGVGLKGATAGWLDVTGAATLHARQRPKKSVAVLFSKQRISSNRGPQLETI